MYKISVCKTAPALYLGFMRFVDKFADRYDIFLVFLSIQPNHIWAQARLMGGG